MSLFTVAPTDERVASQSEAKRKPLSDRALEYPAKPTSLAAAPSAVRSNMKPQSLAGMSGVSTCLLS